MRGNWTNMGWREYGLTARYISRARTVRSRYQRGRAVRLEDRMVGLVDGFMVGMREVLEHFMDLEEGSTFSRCMTGRRRLAVQLWRIWI